MSPGYKVLHYILHVPRDRFESQLTLGFADVECVVNAYLEELMVKDKEMEFHDLV